MNDFFHLYRYTFPNFAAEIKTTTKVKLKTENSYGQSF